MCKCTYSAKQRILAIDVTPSQMHLKVIRLFCDEVERKDSKRCAGSNVHQCTGVLFFGSIESDFQ